MIEFENVSFSYTGQEHGGLRDINLKISDGECVLFCGRSGCGKTTITRLVNGLIPQFYQGELHGRVLVDGQEISNIPMYQIAAKVGSVFQNPRTQFFNVDTDSEIAFGIENEARPPKKLAERVEQTTEDLHIQKLRNRNIFELSGGEKQKIAFASVYAMNPQIYLLDEPSSNLDMTSIQELKEHLRLIKKQGKTVLIAEHRLYYLMELADRIVYLENGEIKLAEEPKITCQCLRVPVLNGHTAAVFINFEKKPTKEQLIEKLESFKGFPQEAELPSAPKQFIQYLSEDDRPQVKADVNYENGMGVSLGRLREDSVFDYKFVGLSHNTLRGAAGGAVLIAELLKAQGYITPKDAE